MSSAPLACSLVSSLCSLFCLLHTAHFTYAICYTHLFARSLTHSLLRLWESELLMSRNDLVLSHSAMVHWEKVGKKEPSKKAASFTSFSSSVISFPLYLLISSKCCRTAEDDMRERQTDRQRQRDRERQREGQGRQRETEGNRGTDRDKERKLNQVRKLRLPQM